MDRVVLAALDDQDGPLLSSGASEDQQRSFDSTCRKFYRFGGQRKRVAHLPTATTEDANANRRVIST
jgi:hypothetical protein